VYDENGHEDWTPLETTLSNFLIQFVHMPKEFPAAGVKKFKQLPTGISAANADRPLIWQEKRALRHGELSEFVPSIHVWYLDAESGWNPDDMETSLAPFKEVVSEHNESTTEDERGIDLVGLNRREFPHALKEAYGNADYSSSMPDLIVLDRRDDQTDYSLPKEVAPLNYAYLQHYLEPIDQIREAALNYHSHTLHNGLPEEYFHQNDTIDQALVDRVFLYPVSDENTPITVQDALAHAFYALVDNESYSDLLSAVRQYVEEDDFGQVERLFTDELLQKLITQTQEFDKEKIVDDYLSIQPQDEAEARAEKEINYRKRVAELCSAIDLGDFRSYALSLLRRSIDSFKEEILFDEDWERWTARVIQPITASVSPNISFQRHALEHGVNAIPTTLNPEDMQRLALMSAKAKSDWQSMAPERTRRFKRQFYERHASELEERAMETADTEQELGIIGDILEQEQLMKDYQLQVLDIGSGTGRITIPLSERYSMTGLDGNQHFLEEADRRAEGKAVFKKGDIISYKDNVEHEVYDSVLYTWHSFLEAYGIGNTLETLTSAWLALRPGGTLIFDMPSRDNHDLEDGWYEYNEETGPGYIAYIMEKDELAFTLKLAGFDSDTIEIKEWTTAPTSLYPEGMKKWTVTARKPSKANPENDQGDKFRNLIKL